MNVKMIAKISTGETMSETLTVLFKRGIRPDGALEWVTVSQEGYGELRLTHEQAKSLHRVLTAKFGAEPAEIIASHVPTDILESSDRKKQG